MLGLKVGQLGVLVLLGGDGLLAFSWIRGNISCSC